MKTKRYKLGEIELKDSVYVSDPCYDTETWCQALVENLKPGKYIGYMKKADFGPGGLGGMRVTDIWITHTDYPHLYPVKILDETIDIGVDSGQAGIYDKEYYEKYHIPELDEHWYNKEFDLIYCYDIDGNKYIGPYPKINRKTFEIEWISSGQERRDGIALDKKGVVSFSGFGDGSYDLYARKNKEGQIIGLRINFIDLRYEEDDS